MGDSTHSDFPAALCRAQRKIEQWRQQRRPRARIPEELWRQAAELACAYGINRTAKALRLDYYSLKKRLAAAARSGEHMGAAARSGERLPVVSRSGQHAAEFVEILHGGMPADRSECLIELKDASGAKMRIRVQGGGLPDVAALTRVFRACHGDAPASREGRS
jgi:hypothetical protein